MLRLDDPKLALLETYLSSLVPSEQVQYMKLARNYADSVLHGRECNPRMLNLPHPQRIAAFGHLDAEAALFRSFAPAVWEAAGDPQATRYDMVRAFLLQHPLLAELVSDGHTEVLQDICLRLMVKAGRARQLQTTDALEQLLRHSDFGCDVPGGWFRTPYPGVYIEFGSRRDFPVSMRHPESGVHVVEGCYLFEGCARLADRGADSEPVRGYDVIICGSAAGKEGVLDDVYVHMAIAIEDENEPIISLVKRTIEQFRKRTGGVPNDEAFLPVIEHVAKVLVYLNTAEARRLVETEGTEAIRRIAAIKSPAKIEKAKRHAAHLYDRVVVGPTVLPEPCGDDASGSEMRTHWRRGHIRAQAYGVQHSLRRPVWIQPMLVRADKLGDGAAQSPTYLVK